MKLLARRDHSVYELTLKLKPFYSGREIDTVIARCLQDNWLDDARFAENYIRSRSNSGYGPRRIALELQQKGVAGEIIRQALQEAAVDWQALLLRLLERRMPLPEEPAERIKLQNMLLRRGFSSDLIQRCFFSPEI
ncbi:regulatory protein RecX [Tolumonas osonensis]|uniref:Regulatory protein RecX n=1 Tax=Tolumonas osonensis TaxID=675874 RepID=A0A841GKK0_9GAMM|nr:regulatory protein RecX [Tolumonas osonensis]MBB6055320.1 regulatory protein [Tolumonas osonensis]